MSLVMSCNKEDDYEPVGIMASPYKITCDEITLTHSYNGEYKDEYDYYGYIDPQGETVNLVIKEEGYFADDDIFYTPIEYNIKIQGLSESETYSMGNYINSEWDSTRFDITKPIISEEGVSISLLPETNLTSHPTLKVKFDANNTGKDKKVSIDVAQVTNNFMADIILIQKSI